MLPLSPQLRSPPLWGSTDSLKILATSPCFFHERHRPSLLLHLFPFLPLWMPSSISRPPWPSSLFPPPSLSPPTPPSLSSVALLSSLAVRRRPSLSSPPSQGPRPSLPSAAIPSSEAANLFLYLLRRWILVSQLSSSWLQSLLPDLALHGPSFLTAADVKRFPPASLSPSSISIPWLISSVSLLPPSSLPLTSSPISSSVFASVLLVRTTAVAAVMLEMASNGRKETALLGPPAAGWE